MRETKKTITETVVERRYPDFTGDIALLKKRAEEVGEHRGSLIEKWLTSLLTLQKEMRHLERLENFSNALTEKKLEDKTTENS